MHSYEDDVSPSRPERESARTAPGDTRSPSVAGVLHLQRAAGNAGVSQLLRSDEDRTAVEEATSGAGAPLDTRTRLQMDQALGADFSSVRVHTGDNADASARQLGAHAYTVGDDVVFADGRYDPGSTIGQRMLAHELTHVTQQRSGPVDGSDTGRGVKVSDPSDAFEQAAERAADSVIAGRLAETSVAPVGSVVAAVQRQDEEEDADDLAVASPLQAQRVSEEDDEPEV
jgi:Domain of unknown function (DUF4157)